MTWREELHPRADDGTWISRLSDQIGGRLTAIAAPGWTQQDLTAARAAHARRHFEQYAQYDRQPWETDAHLRDNARQIAQVAIPDTATYHARGHLSIVNTRPDAVTSATVERTGHTLDMLDAANPLPQPLQVTFTGKTGSDAANTGPSTMVLHGQRLGPVDTPRKKSHGYYMPAADQHPSLQYEVTHEYGHALMYQRDHGAAAQRLYNELDVATAWERGNNRPGVDTLSMYASNDYKEAYAEAFAEWSLIGGKTANPVVQKYAREFGWGITHDLA